MNPNNHPTTKPSTLLTVALALTAAMGMRSSAQGREWSEEVQMTNAREWFMRDNEWRIAVDRNDVIHAAYTCSRVFEDSLMSRQPVYQRFDRYGEPLSDPLPLGRVVPFDVTWVAVYDLELDEEDNVHILWGANIPYHTMLSNNGEVLIPKVRLEGLTLLGMPEGENWTSDEVDMSIVGDQIYTFAMAMNWDGDNRDPNRIRPMFGRYDFEGNLLLDTLIAISTGTEGYVDMILDRFGNRHFKWSDVTPGPINIQLYGRMNENDEIVIDRFIPPPTWENELFNSWSEMAVDSLGGFYLSDQQRRRSLARYNPDTSRDWVRSQARVGRIGRPGQILCDQERGIIHDIEDYNDTIHVDYGYSRFDMQGNQLDSLTAMNKSVSPGMARIALFSDGEIAVVWADSRFYEVRRQNAEMFMRFTIPEDTNIVSDNPYLPKHHNLNLEAHPNPFNSSVTLKFNAPNPGDYKISISDLQGRAVWEKLVTNSKTGWQTMVWQGTNHNSVPMPSGSYWFSAQGAGMQNTIPINLVR